MHWLVGPEMADRADPLRENFMTSFFGFVLQLHGHPRRGTVLGVRDKVTGKLVAVVLSLIHI